MIIYNSSNVIKKLFLTILIPFLISCSEKNDKSSSQGDYLTVKIGQAGPLTGTIAHLGKDNENGAILAINEANAMGHIINGKRLEFKLFSEDDEGKEEKSTTVAQRLVDEGVIGIVGHLNSGTTIPASKVYYDNRLAQISPSATNVLYTSQGFDTAFRVMANDSQQGVVLGSYAVKNLQSEKIAIIDDRTSYGKGLADEFEKAVIDLNGKIVTREFTDKTKTDFTAILTRIKSMEVDLIFFGGMDVQGGPMMKQLKNLGLKSKFLTGDGCQTPQFLNLASKYSEGAYASSPGLPISEMSKGKEFIEKYKSTFGFDVQLYAPYAYDATNVLIEAILKAESYDPDNYLPFLKNIEYDGITGPISFDEKGDIKRGSISIYVVKNGEWTYLETIGE